MFVADYGPDSRAKEATVQSPSAAFKKLRNAQLYANKRPKKVMAGWQQLSGKGGQDIGVHMKTHTHTHTFQEKEYMYKVKFLPCFLIPHPPQSHKHFHRLGRFLSSHS